MKTSELDKAALNWAVAKLEEIEYTELYSFDGIGNMYPPTGFSTDWAQGGPIIEREITVIRKSEKSTIWFASIMDASMDYMTYEGPTPLVAAMRCYVASKLGDEIEIPQELLK